MRERPVSTRRAPLGALGHGMPCPYILEPYVEHGEQAQRSNGGPIASFGRQVGRVEDGRGCSGRRSTAISSEASRCAADGAPVAFGVQLSLEAHRPRQGPGREFGPLGSKTSPQPPRKRCARSYERKPPPDAAIRINHPQNRCSHRDQSIPVAAGEKCGLTPQDWLRRRRRLRGNIVNDLPNQPSASLCRLRWHELSRKGFDLSALSPLECLTAPDFALCRDTSPGRSGRLIPRGWSRLWETARRRCSHEHAR